MPVASRDPTDATSGTNSPSEFEVWSEKGTIRGVLAPVLDQYAVGFRVMHGFSSATSVHDAADDDDGRDLIALYVGDYDPSGLFMSEQDLPARLAEYDGEHVDVRRIALIREQVSDLPSFPAADKKKDPRHDWFVENYGKRCWELDAIGPQRPPRLRRAGHHRVDRTRGVETLRGRQPGGTRVVADDPSKVEGRAMTGVVLKHALSERGDDLYALELKAGRGRLTDVQRVVQERLRAAGAQVAVAHGIDEALKARSLEPASAQ